jgi:hypothetical protein
VKANLATIVVPLVAVAFLLMVAYFVKSGTRAVSTPSEFRDQWFANNLVTGKAGAHYYPPHTNGREGDLWLAAPPPSAARPALAAVTGSAKSWSQSTLARTIIHTHSWNNECELNTRSTQDLNKQWHHHYCRR